MAMSFAMQALLRSQVSHLGVYFFVLLTCGIIPDKKGGLQMNKKINN